ncbi:MAG: TIGR01777 family protein [Acidobacteria bacterium]|nr:MAG: TIGR01777 family protein [Acidobacteriota bacterium]
MKYGLTGASGLIGSALSTRLRALGHETKGLPRLVDDPGLLSDCDVIVHLAGASIAEGRWTKERKQQIHESRVNGTKALVATLGRLKKVPPVLVSGSAIGFYGDRGNEELNESSRAGRGFLPEVCAAWEAEALNAAKLGMRVVLLRTGIVLSTHGGAFPRLLQPFQWYVGGPLGMGQQWMSWIHIEDQVEIIRFASETETVRGPVNATAPNPVTNLQFAKELGRLLGRPSLMRTPAFAVRTALGREMADELLLTSQKVLPAKLQESRFSFRFPTLTDSLQELLGKKGHKR